MIFSKNNHFHMTSGEVWDLEAAQDAMRDIIAPYAVTKGYCNIILDLTQLSDRHLYNKPFALSVKHFLDNIYGVKLAILVIPDDGNRKKMNDLFDFISGLMQTKLSIFTMKDYQSAMLTVLREGR